MSYRRFLSVELPHWFSYFILGDRRNYQNVHRVQVSAWFIKQQDFSFAENWPGKAHQLFVAVTEDTASIHKNEIKLAWKLLDYRLQPNLPERKRTGEISEIQLLLTVGTTTNAFNFFAFHFWQQRENINWWKRESVLQRLQASSWTMWKALLTLTIC